MANSAPLTAKLSPSALGKLTGPIENDDDATRRLASLSILQTALQAFEQQLRGWARQHGGIRGVKGVWQEQPQAVERILPTVEALELLQNRLGDHFLVACQPQVTKAGLVRACAHASVDLSEMLHELRRVGAVVTEERTVWRTQRKVG